MKGSTIIVPLLASLAAAAPLEARTAPFATSLTVVTQGEFNDYTGMNILASNGIFQVGDNAATAVACNPKTKKCPNKGTTFASIPSNSSADAPVPLHLNSQAPKGGQLVYIDDAGQMRFNDLKHTAPADAITTGFYTVSGGNELHFGTAADPDAGFFVCYVTETLWNIFVGGVAEIDSDSCFSVQLFESLAKQGYGAYAYA